jgi:hypothetical protein
MSNTKFKFYLPNQYFTLFPNNPDCLLSFLDINSLEVPILFENSKMNVWRVLGRLWRADAILVISNRILWPAALIPPFGYGNARNKLTSVDIEEAFFRPQLNSRRKKL